ncbi:DUF397 domain-containing protein [Nocardia sp. BSTN01]|uniref:DUF397 domain-containing protein n=1 Tax=Nocardia sp. BSTN01 TaxID=2783665 RepID=UPI0018904822|nr:DUF397 domain-containing protein [Nocardia sp. BSTN01]MBF5000457.1 DUF397 domain-containing protein [Nocardia sp. BSTN01]
MSSKYDVDLSSAQWFTSSRTNGGRECVEVAFLDGGFVGVRDSKDRTRPPLVFTPGEWRAFIGGAKDGEFDRA